MTETWSPEGLVVSEAFRRYVERLRETCPPREDLEQALAATGGDESTCSQNTHTA